MILGKNKYTIHTFQPQHIDATAQLLANSFINLNPIWKAFNISYETAYKVIRLKIRPLAKVPYSQVLMDENDRIVGCSINADLAYLQKNKEFQHDNEIDSIEEIELFKFLGGVEKQLEKDITNKKVEVGEVAYGYYGAVDPSISNQGIAFWLFHTVFFQAKLTKWKYYYSRITSPFTLKILENLGAKQINQVTVNLPERGLKDFTIYLIEFKLENLKTQAALL